MMSTATDSTVAVACAECGRQRSVDLPADATRTDQQPDGVVEVTCPQCGETTVFGFHYNNGNDR